MNEILNEATLHIEAEKITLAIMKEIENDFENKYNHYTNITNIFKLYLPTDIFANVKKNNISFDINYKKISESSKSIINCGITDETKEPKIRIKYFSTTLNKKYIMHEVTHALDQARAFGKSKNPDKLGTELFSNRGRELFSVGKDGKDLYDEKVSKFLDTKYKTKLGKKIGYEKRLGDIYKDYNKEPIEFNQRITEFIYKMKSSSFRSRMMNNGGHLKNINSYEDLVRNITTGLYTTKLVNDPEFKRNLITRLSREGVLKYINPEIFNSKIAANNTKARNSDYSKVISAKSEMKRLKELGEFNKKHEETKRRLEAYRLKKDIAEKNKGKPALTKAQRSNNIDAIVARRENAAKNYQFKDKDKPIKDNEVLGKWWLDEETMTEELLTEGIKYFKTSDKLKKLNTTLSNKLERIEEPEERRKVITLLNKIDRLAEKFDKIEKEYKIEAIKKDPSPDAKQKYAELTIEFKDIIKLAKTEEMKGILKAIGSYGLLFATMTIPFFVLSKINPIINPENNNVKRALAYIGMSIPLRLVNTNGMVDTAVKTNPLEDSLKSMEDKNI